MKKKVVHIPTKLLMTKLSATPQNLHRSLSMQTCLKFTKLENNYIFFKNSFHSIHAKIWCQSTFIKHNRCLQNYCRYIGTNCLMSPQDICTTKSSEADCSTTKFLFDGTRVVGYIFFFKFISDSVC